MSDRRLDSKRILVTQAEDYMGPATIDLFREQGAEVIADNADLTRPGAVEELIEKTGHIDVLVANAGIRAFGTILDTTEDDWDRMLAVNLKGVNFSCKAVLPKMIEQSQSPGNIT